MIGAVISYALLAALATALLIAALTDLRHRHIANELNLAIALAAPLWWLCAGFGWWDIGVQLALAALTLLVAGGLFAVGQMGGGDLKLLTALALWFVPAAFLKVVMLMAILGGGGSLAMAALNMTPGRKEKVRDILAGLAAMAFVLAAGAIAIAVATGRPVLSPAAVNTLASLSSPWLTAAIVLAVFAFLIAGMRHITVRQKTKAEVPYGIAISAAALWVLGSQTAFAGQLTGHIG